MPGGGSQKIEGKQLFLEWIFFGSKTVKRISFNSSALRASLAVGRCDPQSAGEFLHLRVGFNYVPAVV